MTFMQSNIFKCTFLNDIFQSISRWLINNLMLVNIFIMNKTLYKSM